MPVICHPELAIRHRQSVRCEMNKFDDMMLLGMKGAVFGNRVAGIVAMSFVTFHSFGNRMCNLELINTLLDIFGPYAGLARSKATVNLTTLILERV